MSAERDASGAAGPPHESHICALSNPALPCPLPADDVLLSVSAKKKLAVQRSQEVVRGRLLLRNYTQVGGATWRAGCALAVSWLLSLGSAPVRGSRLAASLQVWACHGRC